MTKITKTNDEWKKSLSEDSYKVTRESGTERPYTENIGILMKKVFINAFVVMSPYLNRRQSLMLDVGGPVFLSQCMIQQYQSMKIIHLLEQELK